jgi:LemA protein
MPDLDGPFRRSTRRRGLIAGLLLVVGASGWDTVRVHNQLVDGADRVDAAWAQVDNVLQRRADLIPRVAAVAEAGAAHERAVLEMLARASRRYEGTGAPTRVEDARAMERALEAACVTIEASSTLSATEGWDVLRRELAGSENRIAVERRRYNEAVRAQRARLRTVPGLFLAPLFGFTTPPEY